MSPSPQYPKKSQWFMEFMFASAAILAHSSYPLYLTYQHTQDNAILIICHYDKRKVLL